MPTINELQVFAGIGNIAAGDVMTPQDYADHPQTASGHQPGIANRALENTALRQLSRLCRGLAQFIAEGYAPGVVDDGDAEKIVDGMWAAIGEIISAHNSSAESHPDIRALIAAIDPGSLLATANLWAKAQRYAPYALSIVSGAVAWDVQAHPVAILTLTANVTSLTLSNTQAGATYELTILQDATGGRTMSWPAAWRWPGGSAPEVSAAAGAEDLIHLTTRDVSGTVIVRATAAQALAVV